MKKNQRRPHKYDHAGKSKNEKEAYNRFITRSYKFGFDKTLKDENDIINTDTSKFDLEEDKEDKKEKSRSKSPKYQTIDWLRNNLIGILITILTSIIIFLFTLYTSNNREIGEIKSDLNFLSKDIENVQEKYQEGTNISNELELFKLQIRNDLDSIKKRIENIEKKL